MNSSFPLIHPWAKFPSSTIFFRLSISISIISWIIAVAQIPFPVGRLKVIEVFVVVVLFAFIVLVIGENLAGALALFKIYFQKSFRHKKGGRRLPPPG